MALHAARVATNRRRHHAMTQSDCAAQVFVRMMRLKIEALKDLESRKSSHRVSRIDVKKMLSLQASVAGGAAASLSPAGSEQPSYVTQHKKAS